MIQQLVIITGNPSLIYDVIETIEEKHHLDVSDLYSGPLIEAEHIAFFQFLFPDPNDPILTELSSAIEAELELNADDPWHMEVLALNLDAPSRISEGRTYTEPVLADGDVLHDANMGIPGMTAKQLSHLKGDFFLIETNGAETHFDCAIDAWNACTHRSEACGRRVWLHARLPDGQDRVVLECDGRDES